MSIFKIEHSRTGYFADFVVYFLAIVATSMYLIACAPRDAWVVIALAVGFGLVGFTLLEYLVHRFVFHGLQPFRRWHGEHHLRPQALIGTPTVITVAILIVCIYLPAAMAGTRWLGFGLSLGMASGFFAYSWIHHATHHQRARTPWMKRRKQLHGLHHGSGGVCMFGVTTAIWDQLFGSAR